MMHLTSPHDALVHLHGGLVVSCQAPPGSPLRDPVIMAAMAKAAAQGGAMGIRANGPDDVRAILNSVPLPVLGLNKVEYPDSPVYITPTITDIDPLLMAGCRLIALDATSRLRPAGVPLHALVEHIHAAGALAFGDIAGVKDIEGAVAAGVDAIGTTLSGYTGEEPPPTGPDLALVRELARRVTIPIYAEGRYSTPTQIAKAREAGAAFVVVGGAITDLVMLTRRLVTPLVERAAL